MKRNELQDLDSVDDSRIRGLFFYGRNPELGGMPKKELGSLLSTNCMRNTLMAGLGYTYVWTHNRNNLIDQQYSSL